MNWSAEHVEAKIKLTIAISFCITIVAMVFLSMYSLVFVPQPMNGIAPADKQFFFLLSDMSKYILGSLGTLLAIKGKDAITEMLPPKKPDPTVEQAVEQKQVTPVVINQTITDTTSVEQSDDKKGSTP